MGHMIEPKPTKVFIEDYKGNKMFSIWPVDHEGNKTAAFPIISFGKTKAKELLKYNEELKKYVGEK
jgi:hypothetical protein